MKRFISCFVAIALVLTFSLSALADDGIHFTPSLTNTLNDGSFAPDSDWTATGYNRALATFLLILDVCSSNTGIEASNFDFYNSYVGSSDVALIVTMPYGNNKIISILYNPLTSVYSLLDWSYSGTLSETLIEKVYKDSGATCYKNSSSDLNKALDDISDVLGN